MTGEEQSAEDEALICAGIYSGLAFVSIATKRANH